MSPTAEEITAKFIVAQRMARSLSITEIEACIRASFRLGDLDRLEIAREALAMAIKASPNAATPFPAPDMG